MEFLQNSRYEKIFESIALCITGLVLFVLSFFNILDIMCYALGSISFITGVLFLFGYAVNNKRNDQSMISKGVILILLTFIIVFFSKQIMSIFTVIISIFFFYIGVQHLILTLDFMSINEHHWKIDLIYTISLFVLAIGFIVLDTITEYDIDLMMSIGGAILLVVSSIKIVLLWKVHPSYNKRTNK